MRVSEPFNHRNSGEDPGQDKKKLRRSKDETRQGSPHRVVVKVSPGYKLVKEKNVPKVHNHLRLTDLKPVFKPLATPVVLLHLLVLLVTGHKEVTELRQVVNEFVKGTDKLKLLRKDHSGFRTLLSLPPLLSGSGGPRSRETKDPF